VVLVCSPCAPLRLDSFRLCALSSCLALFILQAYQGLVSGLLIASATAEAPRDAKTDAVLHNIEKARRIFTDVCCP
jgi:hypothetical protein